jgi:glyoxylase-like metal-dependent hydrolase (beta-lactamase superfamily II)
MADTIKIGDFTVTVLTDGASYLPPSAYPGADFSRYPGLLDAHGTYRIRIGAHLVQGPAGTFLIDAGAGELTLPFPAELAAANGLQDPPPHMASAGALPRALADAGVTPADIDHVFITHLHLDHVGWLMKDAQPFFPRATVHFGREDWALLVDDVPENDPTRVLMREAEAAGILRAYDSDDVEVLPGVTAVQVPGHTPGHRMIQLESKGEKLWFVGDLIEHPGQLTDRGIHFMTDVDRTLAAAARARLLAQAKAESIVIAAAHLDDPVFRRIDDTDAWADAAAG